MNPRRFHAGMLVAAVGIATGFGLTERAARACSPGMSAPTTAFPAAGATEVSPQTSIVLRTGSDGLPAGLALLANGSPVPLPVITRLGSGLTPAGHATFFQLRGPLMPSTNYALVSAGTGAGGPMTAELTHFSTSATYDKTQGTVPVINSLRLWRGHYPDSEVAAGGCVFSAYEGYFAVDFTAGSVPGTPPDEVVSILTLSSKQTPLVQSLVFMGLDELPGGFMENPSGNIPLPGGGSLSAPGALWKPVLETGGTTCATISTFGRNDLAALPLQSNTVCVPVTSVDSPELASGVGGAGGADAAGGRGVSSQNGGDAGTLGGGGIGGAGGGGVVACSGKEKSGCSVDPEAGDFGHSIPALGVALLGLVASIGSRRARG